tara:strand:+ start:295 stop:513 length:219 start_codon:yes stop_codon:yes gene_type:complete
MIEIDQANVSKYIYQAARTEEPITALAMSIVFQAIADRDYYWFYTQTAELWCGIAGIDAVEIRKRLAKNNYL